MLDKYLVVSINKKEKQHFYWAAMLLMVKCPLLWMILICCGRWPCGHGDTSLTRSSWFKLCALAGRVLAQGRPKGAIISLMPAPTSLLSVDLSHYSAILNQHIPAGHRLVQVVVCCISMLSERKIRGTSCFPEPECCQSKNLSNQWWQSICPKGHFI